MGMRNKRLLRKIVSVKRIPLWAKMTYHLGMKKVYHGKHIVPHADFERFGAAIYTHHYLKAVFANRYTRSRIGHQGRRMMDAIEVADVTEYCNIARRFEATPCSNSRELDDTPYSRLVVITNAWRMQKGQSVNYLETYDERTLADLLYR